MTTQQRVVSEKAELIADIRHRLPFVRIGHPELADQIEQALDMVEREVTRDEIIEALVLAHEDHGFGAKYCTAANCSARSVLDRLGIPRKAHYADWEG